MNVFDALISLQNSLPEDKTYSQMIHTILNNLDMIKNCTIYDVADLCYTSTASVSRLCNKLGYQSFTVFRSELAEIIDNYEFHNRILSFDYDSSTEKIFTDISAHLAEQAKAFANLDFKVVEQMTDLLHSKKSIHYYTHFFNPFPFTPLQHSLVIDGKETYYHCLHDKPAITTSSLTEDSAVILNIPNFPAENPMLPFYELVRKTPASVILFIVAHKSYWQNADLLIYIPGTGSYMDVHLSTYILELAACIYRKKYIDCK